MEPEPDRIDLSILDPTRDAARFDDAVARIAQRGIELRRLRRAVVRRGAVAFAVAMAAALVLWFTAPRRDAPHGDVPHADDPHARRLEMLDWATRDVQPAELLELGGSHAQ